MTDPAGQILVVAHTHWDREWYHMAERFRQRLVGLVDDLLDDPPPTGASFLLDGQAVLLDDYLAVRPERAAELSSLLRDGRLEAGPWYVLPDELIPSGEALVRNLLAGRDTVHRMRGMPPNVLYCPDSFGHPAILPELADGFGCSLVVLWRGYGGARWPAGDTAHWRGPSGAEVVLHHLPPDGYEFGSSLPNDAVGAGQRWRRISSVLLPRANAGVALLLNGADHHARQRQQSAAVSLLADAASPVSVRASSLASAADAIVRAAGRTACPSVSGELRDSYGYTWTLGGTLASRAAQKRRNALAERTLVRDVEPWIALAPDGGDSAARALLHAAWRDLLRGHPHDTLCGTSIDAVARALDGRLAAVQTQAEGLRLDALASAIGHDAEHARLHSEAWRPAVVMRNPVARTRSGVAELRLSTKLADIPVGPGSAGRGAMAEVDVDERWVTSAGMQVVGSSQGVSLTESPRAYPDADLVHEVHALAWVAGIRGYQVTSTPLAEVRSGSLPTPVGAADETLDNGLLRVTLDVGGGLRVEDRATGHVVSDLLSFELERDAGDLYTPAIRESLGAIPYSHGEVTMRGPLRGELSLRFTDGVGGSTITLRVQLDAGLAAVRLLVDGMNQRDDVRLRMHCRFALGAGATTIADAAFHPVARTVPVISNADARMEQVVRTAPLHRFVSRCTATRGATLLSDGLAEYESLDDGGIAVTLLRAVGELSRNDLPERPGHAGWPAPTPDAQSHGPYDACFAIALHGPDSSAQRDAVERLADDVLHPMTGDTLRSSVLGAVSGGGLELRGEGLAFSAALPSRRAGWITLRCVNRRADVVRGQWVLSSPVHEAFAARLDETSGDALLVRDGVIDFDASAMAIVTVLARIL